MKNEFGSVGQLTDTAGTPTQPPAPGVPAKRPSMVGNLNGRHWLPEHDKILRDCVASGGFSYAEIAAKIRNECGVVFSRNAAIGRANRLGLQSSLGPKDSNKTKPRKPPREREPRRRAPPTFRAAIHFQADANGYRCAPVEPLHVSLADLEHDQCRWPYGDGPFTFCGHTIIGGGSYCDLHEALSIDRRFTGERPDQAYRLRKLAGSSSALRVLSGMDE